MKKIAVLTSVLALAACSKGTANFGGNAVAWETPASVRSANANVTQMETWISSAGDVIAWVEGRGVNLGSGSQSSSRASAIREAQSEAFKNATYDKAIAEIQNLLDIYNGDKTPTKSQLKNAWLLWGGDESSFTSMYNKDGADYIIDHMRSKGFDYKAIPLSFDIVTNMVDGRDHYFLSDTQPEFDDIRSVKFELFKDGGSDNHFRFNLDDNSTIKSVTVYNKDSSELVTFNRDMDKDKSTKNKDVYKNTFGGGQVTIESFGQGNLRYADFGFVYAAGADALFSGGYDMKLRETKELYTEKELLAHYKNGDDLPALKFKGTAVGLAKKFDSGDGLLASTRIYTNTNKATLDFDKNGAFTANLPFGSNGSGNFYDVQIDSADTSFKNVYIQFRNKEKVDSDFRIATEDYNNSVKSFDALGFGDGVITEIVSTATFSDKGHVAEGEDYHTVEIVAGFKEQ